MLRKSLLSILVITVFLTVFSLTVVAADPIQAPGGTVSNVDEFLTALGGDEAATLKEGTLLLLSDIVLSSPIVITCGEYTLVGAGSEITATFTDAPVVSLTGKGTTLSLGKRNATSDSDSLLFNGESLERTASFVSVGAETELNIYMGTVFYDVVSTVDGGVVFNEGSVMMYGGRIERCRSMKSGGAIYNDGELFLASGSIQEISAELGGAIFNVKEASLLGTEISQAIATKGGCIYNVGTLEFISSSTSDSAATEGGAVYNEGIANFSGGQILRSKAENGRGGAVYNAGTVTCKGTYFDESEARFGGTVFNSGTLTISEGHLHGGKAVYGGQVYNTTEGTVSIAGGTLSAGKATVGGAVYNEGNIKFSGGTVYFNKADIAAGIMNLGTMTVTELGHIDHENEVFIPITDDNRHAIRLEGKISATRIATLQPGLYVSGSYETIYRVGDVLVVGDTVSEHFEKFTIACEDGESYHLCADGSLGLPTPIYEQWWFYGLIVLAFAVTVAGLVLVMRWMDKKKARAI